MQLTKTYAGKHFQSIFFVSTLSMTAEYLSVLSGSVIAGQLLGENAVAAIALVMPFFEATVFFSYLVAVGTQAVNALAVGAGDRAHANRLFSTGLLLLVAVGCMLTAAYFLMHTQFSSLFSVSPEISRFASDYFFFVCFLPLLQMLSSFLFCILINEGGEKLCLTASVLQIVCTISLAVLLCGQMGIGGISLSTVLSNLFTCILLATHFTSPKNQLRFSWSFRWRDVLSILKFSLNEASSYLFLAISTFCVNALVAARFGDQGLTVFAVIINVHALLHTMFDGLGDALSGLINTYRGERNYSGIRKTMAAASRTCMAAGLLLTLFLFVCAPWVPLLLGIDSPAASAFATDAVRIFAFSALPMAFLSLFVIYYTYMERIALGVGINSLYLLVLPILFAGIGCFLGSSEAVWTGLMLANLFSVLLGAVFVRLRYRTLLCPLLLDRTHLAQELSYDVPQDKESIMTLVNQVEQDLTKRGVERKKILRIMLMIEESQMLSLERHKEGGIIECTLLLGSRITLILRDSGSLTDPTDENGPIASIESYTGMQILGAYSQKKYLLAGGSNRTIFTF